MRRIKGSVIAVNIMRWMRDVMGEPRRVPAMAPRRKLEHAPDGGDIKIRPVYSRKIQGHRVH